jgi:hypothetical protein
MLSVISGSMYMALSRGDQKTIDAFDNHLPQLFEISEQINDGNLTLLFMLFSESSKRNPQV